MKKSIGLIFGILFITSFVACNASNATSEIPIAVQPTDPTVIFPTSTAPFVPTVDPLTPSAIAQFFHTLEATTVTPESTPTANYRDCSGNMFFMSRGNWGLCHGLRDPITMISQSDQAWQFSYQEYYGRDVPHPCTRLLDLTNDNRFLYFSLDIECELIEPGFISSISVFRMDLASGEVKEILKSTYDFDSYTGYSYTASISPTGRRLAYITDQDRPLKLNLIDLKTGETSSFPLDTEYTFGGRYQWSEDSTKLVFMLESERENDHFISMVFLDLLKADSIVTFIKDKEFNWISSKLEVRENEVKITPYFDDALLYDIETGILSPITQ